MTLKKKIIFGVLVFLLFSVGIGYWIFQKIEDIKENNELSTQIPQSIIELFDRKSAEDYPYKPQEVKWNKEYLLFDEYADLIYNKKRNEKLNTHQYFPNGSINGLVLVKPDTKTLGYYKNDDDDKERSNKRAYQNFYAISYFDKNKKIVLARDTIWGPLPKESKSTTENQHGFLPNDGMPSEKELIEIIKQHIK